MSPQNKTPFVLIISGPTASGKTALAEKIATFVPAQIINADVGQFYKPLSIGTAKPDWQNSPYKQHLFDIIDEPKDLSIFKFYELILEKINQIWNAGELPIIVGGSLFYIKSLYFPPKGLEGQQGFAETDFTKLSDGDLWDLLNKIDPKRASALHKNDRYRIERALKIWQTTQTKPSEYEPEYSPKFNSFLVFINLSRETLHERINKRTEEMVKHGWIDETKKFIDTAWEPFLKRKGLIGYPEIFDWLRKNKDSADIKELIVTIQTRTKQYSKKQLTFWKGLKKLLQLNSSKSKFTCKILEVDDVENLDVFARQILNSFPH